jgi:hypothetical protein
VKPGRRYVIDVSSHADSDHSVDRPKDHNQPGPFGFLQHAAEPKQHAAFVLVQNPDAAQQVNRYKSDANSRNVDGRIVHGSFSFVWDKVLGAGNGRL